MKNSRTVQNGDFTDILWDRGVKILSCTLYFVSSFILSGAGLLAVRAPLCIGLAAACSGSELICVVGGGILGAILRLGAWETLTCIIPLAGIAGVTLMLDKLGIRKKRRLILSVSVFALYFVCSTAVMFAEIPALSVLTLNFCSSLLCGASVTFYSGAVDCIVRKRSPYLLDNHSLVCIVASLCSLLLGASELSLAGFRPARFFGAFVIITASYLFSRSGGSIAGIAIGGCIAVSGTSVALSICYGICGLLSGIFSKFGQIVCAVVFSVTAGIAALLDGSREGLCVFAECALSAFIFAVIPKNKLSRMRNGILNPKVRRIESEFTAAGAY